MPSSPHANNDAPNEDTEAHFERARTANRAHDSRASELAEVLDHYAQYLREGNAPNRTELLDAHPQIARELEECLAGVEFIHTYEPNCSSVPDSRRGNGRKDTSEVPSRQIAE